ncbi:MAG: hypothetical protein WC886_06865 [Saccharofermentanaceae bacterium]|jgi:Na+-transporting methylmalonyl-CoA/oxaloacetate decarboxylase gamma subunit
MENIVWGMTKENGLLGLMCAAIILLFFFVLKWVLKFVGELISQFNSDRESWIKQASEERSSWQKTIDKQNEVWTVHTEQAKLFHENSQEAQRFQRQEHSDIIKGQEKIITSLNEIAKQLKK